ncbi:allergen Tha p 1-like [Nymphalis io]|uniref:allergen Tha p 1-like n=1 Tax=Inachis io TaxID=171585 RepID=UPI0021695E2C|nr:allergen Tha p 1-like [Nymphalis io]
MKIFMSLFGFTLLCLSLAQQYTDRYDNIDIKEITTNRRLLSSYIKCVLDQGRCTPEGKEVKLHIKDAMQTACEKCTETQKHKARIVVNHIREHEKTFWEELKKKYDPDNKYKETYEAFLNSDD